MFDTLAAMKSEAIMETVSYEGYHYVHTSVMKIYIFLLTIAFVPIVLFEGVLMYIYLERHGVSLAKAMMVSFLANLASAFAMLFLFLVENMMNELRFGSVFTAAYLVIIGFILAFMVEAMIIYTLIKNDVKEPMNKAAAISFCVNLASHIGLLVFLSFI